MKTNKTCLVLSLLVAGVRTVLGDSTSAVEKASDKPELIALLRTNYVDFAKIHRSSDDLQDLIAASKGGLSVTTATQPMTGMFSTVLPGNVVYWRAESFTPGTSWQDLAAQTNRPGNSLGLVLDLRSNTTPDDFSGAMEVANFMLDGQSGLVVHGAKVAAGTPAMTATLQGHPAIIVLTNRETRGAAEALAACLQSRGALVMGEATEGKAAVFNEVPLSTGGVLRYATAHVYLADGTDLWNRPVVPDVTTNMSDKDEANALALIDRKQVTDVIGEAASRHRMSEATLVRGQDPEQDAFLASHEAGAAAASALPKTHDVALVEAMDSLKAIRVLQGQDLSNSPTVAVQ
jgi:hypothetical protein